MLQHMLIKRRYVLPWNLVFYLTILTCIAGKIPTTGNLEVCSRLIIVSMCCCLYFVAMMPRTGHLRGVAGSAAFASGANASAEASHEYSSHVRWLFHQLCSRDFLTSQLFNHYSLGLMFSSHGALKLGPCCLSWLLSSSLFVTEVGR